MTSEIPFPPSELMQRVGRIDDPDVGAAYDTIGRHSRGRIERLLPDDWSWEGKRVLDFGCGAGRTLRQFAADAERAEFHGCDIDEASIAWLEDHLVPPFHVFRSGERPPLPREDDSFDLVYALSVFTHVTNWSEWLLELHRVLTPSGLLIATFLHEPHWAAYDQGAWDEDRVGMNVIKRWNPWDAGGPLVFHSEWWIREHWGRAFDVLFLERRDPADPEGQGAALLRAKPVVPGASELEQPADDPRELEALHTNLERLHQEAAELYDHVSAVTASHEELVKNVARLESELERLHGELTGISSSKSWRMTRPLRVAGALVRRPGR